MLIQIYLLKFTYVFKKWYNSKQNSKNYKPLNKYGYFCINSQLLYITISISPIFFKGTFPFVQPKQVLYMFGPA